MSLKLHVLGCGSATPVGQRISSAFALRRENEFFLIDCSEGAQMHMKANGIRMQKISRVFISHLHGDHYFGLIGLLSSLHLFGRTEPIHIYGHSLLKKIIDIQMKAGNTHLTYPLYFHKIKENKHALIYDDDEISVETIPLVHSIPTSGFVFREKPHKANLNKDFLEKFNPGVEWIIKIKSGEDFIDENGNRMPNREITSPSTYKPKSFAYCSDTVFTESVVPYIKNVDLLYHEATFMENMKNVACDKLHATALEAATIAKEANVKRLLIGHYSARYASLEPLLNEARSVFPHTIAAEEGMVLDI